MEHTTEHSVSLAGGQTLWTWDGRVLEEFHRSDQPGRRMHRSQITEIKTKSDAAGRLAVAVTCDDVAKVGGVAEPSEATDLETFVGRLRVDLELI